ncbi:MAG: dienelactone hydrolase family protein [Gammaproteobacteria bacterium]|nr:dienelactone hydrolase family protein [Gammaproteobacteria bacterium]
MCDEHTVRDNRNYLRQYGQLSRRQFGALATGSALAALFPRAANALAVTQTDVTIATPDGEADCFFVHPATGKHAGVIIWPDILGLRPAFRLMGKRLAESGYAVLVVNPYYREVKAPVVEEGASFQDTATREIVLPLFRNLTATATTTDARAFVNFLDQQAAVDTQRKIGTTGYCMGGSMTMRTAAALPGRVGAGASFHGGGLVTDKEDSPHLLVPRMQAHYLVAIAENDDGREPEAKTVLRDSFAAAGLPAEIEVYEGTLHGWCPPDARVYNEAQAERAWARLLVLFETALG